MPKRLTAGCYPAKAVAEFLNAHKERKLAGGTGRNAAQETDFINGHRLLSDDRRRIDRFRTDDKLVSLDLVDRLLIRYGLTLTEYETWATERYGNNTYFDTDEIFVELLAAA